MTLKKIDFNVEMYATTAIAQSTYAVVYTGDEDSIDLRFMVTDEPVLTGATAKVHVYFGDSSHIERNMTLNGSVFNYVLTGTENDHSGVTRADIYITHGGATYTRANHRFRIDKSLEASAPLVEYAIDTVDTVVAGAESWLLQAQTDFGTAQEQRAAEWIADNDDRADAFTATEADRTSTFNTSEASRAVTFNTNETGRSNTFTVNENARQEAAEAGEVARDASYEIAETNRNDQYTIAEENRDTISNSKHVRADADHTTAVADHNIALADQSAYDVLADDLTATLAAANENIENFDIALQEGIIATNIATELDNLESTYAPDLFSVKQQLADTLNKSAITLTHMFADNTARDAYFVANPSELIELQFIKVGTAYQQYIEGVWTDSVPIVAEQVSATNQPIVDTGEYFVAENTNEALQELGAHKANADNPHGVTKTQVGLGNVDNTSDANKPVSTATQAALNLKGDKSVTDSNTARIIKLESNDEPMHYDKVLGEYVNVGKYWDAYRDGKIYTTEFNNYEVSPSPMGTKKDANAGLVAVPSTNLVAGQDDYANIGLFKPVEVNAYVDANDDYHITAIKGDARFKRDGTNGDVYIMNILGYIKRFDTPTTWGYSYSDTLYAGFSVLPEAVKPDGTVRPFLLHAKYIAGVGSDGKLASISGVNPEFNSMSHDGQITKFKAKGEQYSGKTTHDDFWMKLMLFLKYATTNSEAVMRGCISYYLQYQPSIYESGVSRVVLTNAQANALVVGSRVSIGNYAGNTKTDDRGNALVHNVANRVKITSIVALPDGLNSAVNVDAPAFDTNATTTIATVPWGSGACDNVLGNDGSPISNTSGKEPLIINGIETMVGGYEVIQNLMIYNDNTDPLDYKIKVYVCYDAKQYKAGSPSADYKLLSVLMAQTNNTWQYISKLGVDPNHPTALIPVAAAASSTTGFADGVYTNTPTTGYRVWLSLGGLGSGSLCGFFYVDGSVGLGGSSWYVLGRLSATGRSRGELA